MNPLRNCADRNALETLARHHYQTAPLGNGVVLCRILGKYILYTDVEDVGITPHLCLDGFWESWITFLMMRVVEPGWRCIDIGANFGYYTLLLADLVGPRGQVLAIEPNPQAVLLLERSVEVNGFQSSTRILKSAASDRNGRKVTLAIPAGRAMNASLFGTPSPSDQTVDCTTTTVDKAVEEWTGVDFIKIDAEGAEESIWQGMSKVLQKNQNIRIVMELGCKRYQNPAAFLAKIRNAGFALRYVDYDGSVRDIVEERLLTERPNEDWTLFLYR